MKDGTHAERLLLIAVVLGAIAWMVVIFLGEKTASMEDRSDASPVHIDVDKV